jgi:hypothetical protein
MRWCSGNDQTNWRDIISENSMFKEVARMVNEQGQQWDIEEEHVDTGGDIAELRN